MSFLSRNALGSRQSSPPKQWSRESAVVACGTVVIAAVLGDAATGKPKLALLVIGALVVATVGLVFATDRGVSYLALGLVACTFANRFKFSVAGAHLRLEDIILLPLVVSLVFNRGSRAEERRRRLIDAATHPASLLLLAYVAWGLVSSYLFAPQFSASLRIDVWLVLDWLIMVSLVASFESAETLEITAWRFAICAFVIADVLYVIGTQIGFGVQVAESTLTGVKSAYGLSYEANILGSSAAIWLYLAISRGTTRLGSNGPKRDVSWIAILVVSMALIVSFTRGAILGLAVGLIVWGLIDGGAARVRLFRRLGPAIILAIIVLAAVPSVGKPVVTKLGQLVSLSSTTGVVRVNSVNTAYGDLSGMHWVLGLGLNSYGQRHLDPTRLSTDATGYIGEFPVEVLYDTGVVGLILLIGAWAVTRPWRSRHPGRTVGAAAAFLVCSLTTSPFWLGASWLLIALAVSSDMSRRRLELESAEADVACITPLRR